LSEDGGTTWGEVTELVAPPAFGGDTVTSYHITSLYPFYDREDRLHIVSNFMPVIRDTGYIIPAEIWHWTDGVWARIHRAGCARENLVASVGYNAMYACRPTIGEDRRGRLYVAWEQFDSANIEPVTDFLRADVFMAASEDDGQTWLPAVKITDAGTTSCRFPCVVDLALPGEPDTVAVRYLVDVMAGFSVQSEHPNYDNPMVVQKLPVTALGMGIAEAHDAAPMAVELSVAPSPFSARAVIAYAVPKAGPVSVDVVDATGRVVRSVTSGTSAAGRFTKTWDGRDDAGRVVAAGVYVVRLRAGAKTASARLVRLD